MPSLPSTPFDLKGGCFCSAIRYKISVPDLNSRPIIPEDPTDPIGIQNEVTARLPLIDLDHCTSCRRISGSIIETWIISPQSWIQFSLLESLAESTSRVEPPTIDVLTGKSDLLQTTHLKHFSSSKGVNRAFCGNCGTHLTFHYAELGGMAKKAKEAGRDWEPHMDIALGTLDREFLEMDGMRPSEQAHYGDGIGWIQRWLKNGEKSLLE